MDQMLLVPARRADETQADYRARRKLTGLAVAEHLRGRMLHVSSEIVSLPPLGENERFDREVRQGYYRDVIPMTTPNGEAVRLARTKGATYRKPKNV